MRIPSRSNTGQPGSGTGGTLGGLRGVGARPGRTQLMLGDEIYLWILVLVEVVAIGWLRQHFRRYHGG